MLHEAIEFKVVGDSVKVESCFLAYKSAEICVVWANLDDKRNYVDSTGTDYSEGPVVWLAKVDTDKFPTQLMFPTLVGWQIFATGVSKDTIHVVFRKFKG